MAEGPERDIMNDTVLGDGRAPHEWAEAEWRGIVGRVSAGRSLAPATWPNGARCAVAFSFDSDHETNELRDGAKSIQRLSWGQYGSRRGIDRIRRALDRHGVKASFFVPAVSALLHPDEQRALVGDGHEIGLHGWIHELNTALDRETERTLMMRSADTLEKITGTRPIGMRTPSWDFSANTLSIACEMGLVYDSSLMADDDPYEVLADGKPTGLVELPVEWIRDDAVYFNMNRFGAHRPYTPPEAVLDIFRREFEGAYAEGGLFLLTMHPHVIGYRSRIFILEALLEQIAGHDDVWVATHGEIASYVKQQAGL
jgi:peptidoglycan-N-acetylglucosamine deacetylase